MDLLPPQLVVIGGPSVHRVTGPTGPLEVLGGAGLLTALAARLTGASVGLVSRVPPVLPALVRRAFRPGAVDPGGLVPVPGALPTMNLTHGPDGAVRYSSVEPGVEGQTCAADIPRRWLGADHIHVAPLAGDTALQITFVSELRARGYAGSISAGTFPCAVAREPDAVWALMTAVDLFFLNHREAAELLAGALPERPEICLTRGPAGLLHHKAGRVTVHPAPRARVVDPTGAGDALCGGWLGARVQGVPTAPVGLEMARRILEGPGGEPLLAYLGTRSGVRPRRATPALNVAEPDPEQIARLGASLESVASALTFTGGPFPEAGEPNALQTLALATLHQYGFWSADSVRWTGPMYAEIDGVRCKGSDFVWRAFTRAVRDDPRVLEPARLASEPLLFDRICRADDGRCPIPDAASHRILQQAYGEALKTNPGIDALVAAAGRRPRPARRFISLLCRLPGFAEDPLLKKATLLALILSARPEGFLPRDGEIDPIVDYHLMRGCLRTGCVRILEPSVRALLEGRRWVDADTEAAIRVACRDALRALESASGLSTGAIDGFFFRNGRKVCLEIEAPRCDDCGLNLACAREERLFQPVYRTTAY